MKQIEYFLNAIYYSMNYMYILRGAFFHKLIKSFFLFLIRYLTPLDLRRKLLARINNPQNIKEIKDARSMVASGLSDYYFGFFCSLYYGSILWILFSILENHISLSISFEILAVLVIGVGYLTSHIFVIRKNKYIKYFKQFKKKDASWHRKWRWVTIGFMVGGIVISILGFLYYVHNHSFKI